jgi:hypothetical protein
VERLLSGMQGTTSGAVCVDYWSLLHHTIPSRMELDHSRGSHMLKHGVSEGSFIEHVLSLLTMDVPSSSCFSSSRGTSSLLIVPCSSDLSISPHHHTFMVMMCSSHGTSGLLTSTQPRAFSPVEDQIRMLRCSMFFPRFHCSFLISYIHHYRSISHPGALAEWL